MEVAKVNEISLGHMKHVEVDGKETENGIGKVKA